jgi:hypothetical protein
MIMNMFIVRDMDTNMERNTDRGRDMETVTDTKGTRSQAWTGAETRTQTDTDMDTDMDTYRYNAGQAQDTDRRRERDKDRDRDPTEIYADADRSHTP